MMEEDVASNPNIPLFQHFRFDFFFLNYHRILFSDDLHLRTRI